MKNKLQSYLFVIVQFTAIFYLIYGSNLFQNLIYFLVTLPGIFLALWSIWIMQKSVFSVFPDPDPQIILITIGPYKLIRHPMYASLFLVLIPLVIISFSIVQLSVLLIFSVNQIFKLRFEEKLLLEKIPDYKAYIKVSWRLVPFIY